MTQPHPISYGPRPMPTNTPSNTPVAVPLSFGLPPCLVDDEGGVCGRDECPRCGAQNGSEVQS